MSPNATLLIRDVIIPILVNIKNNMLFQTLKDQTMQAVNTKTSQTKQKQMQTHDNPNTSD